MAFINQGRHIGGLGSAFSVESSVGGCVDYTDSGTDYTACTFTSSGILTVTGTGNADFFILSGGGGAGGHGGNAEGGFFRGGGGAGGMLVDTDVEITTGTYRVLIGAGGVGSAANSARTGNLSWITPQRVLTISNLSNSSGFVVGETLTGGTSGATADVISHSPSTTVTVSHDIQLQGQIPDPSASPVVEQIPYHGTPGSSQLIERTLTSLPDFQVSETITGSTNSYTATVGSVVLSGTEMSETEACVGGGAGGPGEEAGYGGGSGGGGASNNWGASGGGTGTTNQGNNGANGGDRNESSGTSGGGGGRGAVGSGKNGGNGAANNFRTGSNITYAGGGGGASGNTSPSPGTGGTGGGGTGASGGANLGGGGGTGNSVSNGGSGIVVVRYDRSQ